MKQLDQIQQSREAYERIPIPDNLDERVREGVRQGRAARAARRRRRVQRWFGAAACFAVLFMGLNLSPTVAHAAAGVPVLGGLFQVLTVVRYDRSEDGVNYTVDVPVVEAEGDTAAAVNAAIQAEMERRLEQARRDWADYQEAFFATGGTEEEWAGREMDVIIDYAVKYQSETQVSFVVTMAECWVAAQEEWYCYNLDLAGDKTITLRDLLGENWADICNEAIRRQIGESRDSALFFAPAEGGFTTVDESTAFYIRADGVPVVVFPRGSIAARAAGALEFPLV
ncbi:MAG: DUF3298 domain-containing protein [Flavonifractor sp.]|nr:DUF3298 domain-containing protein [Flavonifractor sp.]MCI9472534.1 DUF3298 domain-containing protein [Flavonifractor sp.]